jgi:hypothetical protein
MTDKTPISTQILDAGPRGAANLENMAVLSQGSKKTISFFKGDACGTPISTHKVFDLDGQQQSVGMVQTWNQCSDMLLTSLDKRQSVLLMDTETGATKSELSLRRQQNNWKLDVESITPQQKFEQYRKTNEYSLFGLGDKGTTVFAMSHDARAGKNVEELLGRMWRSWSSGYVRLPAFTAAAGPSPWRRGRRHARGSGCIPIKSCAISISSLVLLSSSTRDHHQPVAARITDVQPTTADGRPAPCPSRLQTSGPLDLIMLIHASLACTCFSQADSCRKYKSYTFTAHAQTKAGFLVRPLPLKPGPA